MRLHTFNLESRSFFADCDGQEVERLVIESCSEIEPQEVLVKAGALDVLTKIHNANVKTLSEIELQESINVLPPPRELQFPRLPKIISEELEEESQFLN